MKKARVWWSLARGVLLESLRRKDLWVVAILGFVILISAGAIGFFGFSGLESFAKDLAATVLGAFSTIIAVVTTVRLIPEEIKNRTLYPLISRPITRFDLIFGKFIGAVLVSWISFALLAGLTALALLMFKVQFEAAMLQYVVAKLMGLVLVCGFTLMLSLLMTPSAAVTMSFVLLFGSNMIIQALVMSGEHADATTQTLYRVIISLLPQVGLFDLGSRAANTNWGAVPTWVMLALLGYMAMYTAATLTLSWTKFRKQAV